MLAFIAARVGLLLYWLAIFFLTVGDRKAIIIGPPEPVPTPGHEHLHVADGNGNPGLPLKTGSDGRLIVREVAVRNATAKLSFEHGAGEAASVQAAGGVLTLSSSGGFVEVAANGNFGVNVSGPSDPMEVSLSGSNLGFASAGLTGTEAGHVAVKIGGSTVYLRAFATP